ncbi:hypothetical protein B9Z55_025867 [Caenorhabditis nigoni]|nr:hypothetical protein B9Z55_025867 [Caenorhabditis nigoni]
MYHEAVVFARRNKNEIEPPKQLERYNEDAVIAFIGFITNPTVMIGLPYGTIKAKMSDGSKHEILATIRQQSNAEIVEMYNDYIELTNQTHLTLSKSSIYRILDACVATKRKSTTCVDYFIANGMEAFEGLQKIVDAWIDEGLEDLDTLKKLKISLLESVQYLRTDFRLHVKPSSRVADHCAKFALSDPNDKQLASSCDHGPDKHSHDLKCERCELLTNTLNDMKELSNAFLEHANVLKAGVREEEIQMISYFTNRIVEMKKHYLRAEVTSQEKSNIIENLQDNEALVILDFAQKYLPKWHREKQSDYFGKKGISYHISHATVRVGTNLAQHSFVHIYNEEVKQDSALVVLTIAHLAKELKKVGITKISLRSDNAGAYHCASTLTALPWLQEETGVLFDTYTFSEAQNGKSASDRDASRVKRKAAAYVTKNNDITTSEQFFNALQHGTMLNGVSVHHGSVTVISQGEAKWPGVSYFNHFKVTKDGIIAKRYGSLVEGHLMGKTQFKSLNGTWKFDSAGYVASSVEGAIEEERNAFQNNLETKFWYRSVCVKPGMKSSCHAEKDDISTEIDAQPEHEDENAKKLYACSHPGCSAKFLKPWNLEKHNLRDKHSISPERCSMRDFALQLFIKKLEDVEGTRAIPIIKEAWRNLKEATTATHLTVGWALPVKQVRKPFEKHVVQYLVMCFEEGLTKKRLDPATVEKRMRVEKNPDGTPMFKRDEWKTVPQIAGFFSRECEKRRKNPTRVPRSDGQVEDYLVSEEEHDDSEWIRYLKDETTWTVADEFWNATIANGESIFLYGVIAILICDQISRVYADLYGRCYVPHVEKRQKKIEERCNGVSAPLLKFPDFFLRFSRKCNTFKDFITSEKTEHITTMGIALTTDVTYMNLLSSNLFSNIHSDSELPSLVLKTRLLLQHFSLAAIKLWNQLEAVRACRYETKSNYSETYSNETDEERMAKLGSLITHNCCPSSNIHICDINNERKYQRLAKNASLGFRIEAGLLIAICFNTFLLCFLLCKTYKKLSTATILFVLNIMGSNIAFMLSFTYFFVDLLYQDKYGPINEDYMEKSPELVIAETLQTHLFAHSEFKKHLVQETLYSLAQNGSLTGLIHLLVLVLVVINRSMSGKSIHLSKISVVSVFACVWIFLIASHVMFSIMQMNAINNLDALFSNLSKGRVNLSCNATTLSESGYEEIATHCDRTAIFHAFGAYLLRGHTLFTILFLSASIIIFVITVTYHIKVRRQHDIIHSELRTQSPHQRRERLFHTLILSIVTFFLSVMGQTYIEIAVFWVNEREDIAQLSRWYHYVRILAFIDPVMNPLIVILRTPALRRQLRSQWTTIRSRASSRTRSAHSHRENRENTSVKRKRSSSARMRKDAELMMSLMPTDRPVSSFLDYSSSHPSKCVKVNPSTPDSIVFTTKKPRLTDAQFRCLMTNHKSKRRRL